MAKKAKAVKRTRKPTSYMMVIRVAVPARVANRTKVAAVYGVVPNGGYMRKLEILSAYYDRPGQPNARAS